MYDKFSIKALKNPTFNIFTHQAYISSNISSTSCDRGYQGFLFGGGGIMVAKCVIFFFNIIKLVKVFGTHFTFKSLYM